MLEKLFKKSEVWFAVLFIVIYVIGNGNLIEISKEMGYEMVLTIPLNILLLLILILFIQKNDLFAYFGFCKVQAESKKVLFYLPLIVIATVNLWMGIVFRMDALRTIIYIVAMFFVGAMEELLFRGLLFKAMSRNNIKVAIIVSSITFGAGHIVNLFNGSGMDRLETLCQLFYAAAVGFLLVAVLYATNSIYPCMLTHAVFNSLSVFANEEAFESVQIPVSIALCLISGISAAIIFKINQKKA